MINWYLSLLVHGKVLTLDQAEYLAKELATKTYAQDFTDAHKTIEQLLKDYEK